MFYRYQLAKLKFSKLYTDEIVVRGDLCIVKRI